MLLSDRCNQIKPSATLTIAANAKALRKAGKDIIPLNAGEPGHDTTSNIKAAAIDAIQEGKTRYTAIGGAEQIKDAIVNKLAKDNGLEYTTDEVMATCGGKQAIFNALMATINKGDEVIIQAPYWTSYPDMIKIAQGEPIILPTNAENKYKLSGYQLQTAITPYTKMIILNSPCNPSGAYYNEEDLQAIANVLVEHPKIFILSDDVYEKILWSDEHFKNILNIVPSLKDRTILINSVSKTFSMTGWRLGYAAANEKLIKAMTNIQSQTTSNPCTISQIAAAEALSNTDSELFKQIINKYIVKHEITCQRLSNIEGFKFIPSQGSFYILVDVSELLKKLKLKDDIEFTNFLLNNALVSVVPGSAFGIKNHIRISFGIRRSLLHEAFDRIEKAIEKSIEENIDK